MLIEHLSLHSFYLLFLPLLPLDILPYLFFVQAYRAHTVASRPQVTPLISSPKTLVLLEQPQRRFAFQVSHEF